jgi:hypothetical protein
LSGHLSGDLAGDLAGRRAFAFLDFDLVSHQIC